MWQVPWRRTARKSERPKARTPKNAEQFLEFVQLSGLVADDFIEKIWSLACQSGAPEQAASANYVAQQFVEAKVLTRWQADMLLKGKHKGFLLDRYRLLGHLGTGGMSSVFLAEHLEGLRRVAVKVLPASRVDEPDYLARFYFEARAAASVDHPNIVRVYDIHHEGANYFMVLEYVDMPDLQQVVTDGGPLAFNLAAEYVRQAASGLQRLHETGIIHRNIKPSHLMVDSRGTVKLLDLGLAKFDSGQPTSLIIARDENVLGTVDYLSPEQALNSHTVDGRADVYSLGCTLYFLLTGRPPFSEGSLSQRLMAHQTATPPSIYAARPDTPTAMADLCMQMLAKRPSDRPQSAKEVAKTLEGF